MFVRKKIRKNGKIAVQIVESLRRGNKVHQKVLRHVGQAENESELGKLMELAEFIILQMEEKRSPSLPGLKPEDLQKLRHRQEEIEPEVKFRNIREEQQVIDGIGDIFGHLYKGLHLDEVIVGTKQNKSYNEVLESLVLSRLMNPSSKRRTASLLEEDFGIKISLEKIYRTMDQLSKNEERLKHKISGLTRSLFKNHVDVLFFDVTTLYFESIQKNELLNFGYSKDNKVNTVQVVLSLVTTTDGFPITYKLFPGNTSECKTLIPIIKELRDEYKINRILLVADRAMFNNENLRQMDEEGIKYIVASKLKTLSKNLKEKILTLSDYKTIHEKDKTLIYNEYPYNDNRLIVTYSSSRASKDKSDRERLIKRLLKKVKKGQINVSELISNH